MSSGSASRASLYTVMEIQKKYSVTTSGQGNRSRASTKIKKADIKGRTISFNYFESLYSPQVTANLIFVDAGGSIEADKDQDTQNRLGSIKSSLPITGEEQVAIRIESKSGVLKLTRNPLIVDEVPSTTSESNRESIFLSLVSNPTLKNLEITDPTKTYTGRISDTVKSILKNLNIRKFKIDKTRNSYNFISRSRGGLDLITDLCRRSIPVKGDPGYFFYETQDGFNFRSIHSLISKKPVETYTYTAGLQANLDNDENDFKIVREPNFIKDQKVQERKKWTSSRNIFFNPSTLKTDEVVYTMKTSSPEQTLGKGVTYTDEVTGYTTTHEHVLDLGSLGDTESLTPNNDPREWQAKSPMRYNLLHSQIMEIQVPCNLKLRAGNIIRVEFERQGDDKSLGGIDEQTSGNFLILHLCHHFDTKRSFTSMTIIRDTYGVHTSNSLDDEDDDSLENILFE